MTYQQSQPNYSRVPISQPNSSHSSQHHPQPFASPTKHSYTNQQSSIQSYPPPDPSSSASVGGYRDWIFALLFIAHLLLILIAGFTAFRNYSTELSVGETVRIDTTTVLLLVSILGVGVVVSIGWLLFVRKHARQLIWFTLILGAIASGITIILALLSGSIAATIFAIGFFALNIFYIYSVRNRIGFSATILELSIKCIQLYPATIVVALFGILFQVIWVGIWTVCAFSIYHSMVRETRGGGAGQTGQQTDNSAAQFVGFLLLISLYWTGQVIKNIVHCTVAGVQGVYYFVYPNPYPNPTLNAVKRSCTTSFGSICLGSLILSVIRAVRAVVSMVANSNSENGEQRSFVVGCFIWIAQCILDIIDQIVEYLNMYAFVQVGLYGKDFITASKDTWSLMTHSGFAAIINDSLISSVLSFGSLIGGLVCAVIGGLLAFLVFSTGNWALWCGLAFLIGTVLTMTVMTVVESAVVTLFVCFAEDPAALMRTKPDDYEKLSATTTGARMEGEM